MIFKGMKVMLAAITAAVWSSYLMIEYGDRFDEADAANEEEYACYPPADDGTP